MSESANFAANSNDTRVAFKRRALTIITAVIVLDQLTKSYFHSQLADGQRVNVWFFIALAIGVSLWCWRWVQKEDDGRVRLALALIVGGAIGNVIDRIWLGKVIDFILVYWAPWNFYYPAFNLADSAITVGAVLMIWSAIFARK
jgi:signal peptidase II